MERKNSDIADARYLMLRYLAANDACSGGPLPAVAAGLKNGKEEDVTQAQRTAKQLSIATDNRQHSQQIVG
jgi:hypothetical protein